MDGQQRQLAASMQARLSLWLSLLIFVSAIATAVFSFQAAFSEAIELQDEQLRQLAGLIDRQNKPSIDHVPEGDPNDDDFESRIVVPIEQELLGIPNQTILRSMAKNGIADITL